ncbi:DUF177 domain-containing protein [Urechidicola sp. KH5]
MKELREFDIPFVGLKLGKHEFEYQIDTKFFENYNYDEFYQAKIKVVLTFEKKANMLQLEFESKGVVNVACDVTNEPFDLNVDGKLNLVVKFGEEFNDDDEEILILPHSEYQVNVGQYIYEMIVLSLPIKRVHPGVEDGSLNSEVLEQLNSYKEQKEEIDPRWAKLKEIRTNK